MRNILLLQRNSPFNNSKGREALDMVLALAAVEHNVSVLFSDDGVYQLLPTQHQPDFKLKAYPRSFKLFTLYDIDQVYVCKQSLKQRGIKVSDLSIDVTQLDTQGIAELFAGQHQVISS